jgi:hypothetical protein
MLAIFCCLLFQSNEDVTLSPYAYPATVAETFQGNQAQGRDIYLNDFEQYLHLSTPWPGHNFSLWTVFVSDEAYSGEKILGGFSLRTSGEAWAISESFAVTQDIKHVSIKMQAVFLFGNNTWQIVPQGSEFVMARFIVNPDGSVSVFDADSQDEPIPTPGQVRTTYLAGYWDQLEFKLDRQENRYHIFLNDQHIHTGTPFTTEITNLVVAQTMRSTNANMALDAIEIREDLQAVPTLSPYGLVALVLAMLAAALLLRRRRFVT